MKRSKVGFAWALVWLPLAVALGCQRDADHNLRESYERMIASAERHAPAADAAAPPVSPPDTPSAAPAALPIDTLPAPPPAAAALPEPAAPAAEPDAERPFEGTAGVEQRDRRGAAPVILRAVRIGTHEEFDRVVFEFEGEVPGYHLEYVDRPIRECGSGRTVEVAGQGWLRIRLDPARAHEPGETARATITDRNRVVDLAVVRQLTLTCDFEAQVEWVLGMSSPNRYRVLELREPARLVVDVLH